MNIPVSSTLASASLASSSFTETVVSPGLLCQFPSVTVPSVGKDRALFYVHTAGCSVDALTFHGHLSAGLRLGLLCQVQQFGREALISRKLCRPKDGGDLAPVV